MANQDEAQLINYLKTIGLRLGLLLNFGANKFEMLRRIFDNSVKLSENPW
jgi:GxxExxY protein